MNTNSKTIVGCEEWCAFPGLGIPAIKARVDSGAKTSSIHAFNIQKFRRNGVAWVSFEVHPVQDNRSTVVRCERPVLAKRAVKSSSGIAETRYVIGVSLTAGDKTWDIELTLANRDSMGYRMLLGREAMSGHMLVDPSSSFMLGKVSQEQIDTYYEKVKHPDNGLKIGLLASNPDLYSNKRLLEAGEEHGHQMVFLNINQCYMKLDAEAADVHHLDQFELNDLDAVIARVRPDLTYYGALLARQFESMDIVTVNSSSAIEQSRDTLLSYQLFLKNGLQIPTTTFAQPTMTTEELIEIVGGAPLLVKRVANGLQNGVILAETEKAAESTIHAMKTVNANFIVQEFIKEANAKSIRCIVIDGKVVASIEHAAPLKLFKANIQHDESTNLVKITPEERALAIKAAKVLGLRFAGIDILRARKGPLVLHAKSSPDLESIEIATGKDIAGMMISSIEKKLAWKRELGIHLNA